MKINKIYTEDCLKTMNKMSDNFIDLVVTSPPYDNLRTYKEFDFQYKKVSKELFRVIKDGGICVWVVGDQTIKGNETEEIIDAKETYLDNNNIIIKTTNAYKDATGCMPINSPNIVAIPFPPLKPV